MCCPSHLGQGSVFARGIRAARSGSPRARPAARGRILHTVHERNPGSHERQEMRPVEPSPAAAAPRPRAVASAAASPPAGREAGSNRRLPCYIEGSSLMVVQRNRAAVLQVALLVAVTVRTVFAAPLASTAELRAAYCCATRCGHPQGTLPSNACCGVASQANDPAALAAPLPLHPTLSAHAIPASRSGHDQCSVISRASLVDFRSHGPPLFLKVHSLRI